MKCVECGNEIFAYANDGPPVFHPRHHELCERCFKARQEYEAKTLDAEVIGD